MEALSTTNSNIAAIVPMEIVGDQSLDLKPKKKRNNLLTDFSQEIESH